MPNFDILTAGFPCQSFSIAGQKRGFDDERGNLFFEITRILKDKRPRCFLLENVKNLLSHDSGKTFQRILKELADIGYILQWQVFNTKDYLPQNRERVFIVGYLGEKSFRKIFPPYPDVREDIEPDKQNFVYWKNSKDKWVDEKRDNVPSLKTHTDLCRQTLYKVGVLRTHKDQAGFRPMADFVSPTIPARARNDGSGQPVVLKIEYTLRRLTPLECFRLQGFPDEIVQKAYEIGISDAQLYKMAGNAVTVPIVCQIAKKIKETE